MVNEFDYVWLVPVGKSIRGYAVVPVTAAPTPVQVINAVSN